MGSNLRQGQEKASHPYSFQQGHDKGKCQNEGNTGEQMLTASKV